MYRTRAAAIACIACCLMVSTSAHGSRDCMTQAEARKGLSHLASVLVWQGALLGYLANCVARNGKSRSAGVP